LESRMEYLNRESLARISSESFRKEVPYPWVSIEDTLTPKAFELLRETFPDVSLFRGRTALPPGDAQPTQGRAVLVYRPGVKLPEPWKMFMAELQDEFYESFLRRLFGLAPDQQPDLTAEWHYAWQGCSLSPHCHARQQVGTHIFYFNTEADWDSKWGGEILILDDLGRHQAPSAPAFADLQTAAVIDPRGNGSLIFQRTDHSWHGVLPLESPPERLRKLFVVTVTVPAFKTWWQRVRHRDVEGYRL
jgi:2OG-Fe(II) oxygenase superfamily